MWYNCEVCGSRKGLREDSGHVEYNDISIV
jgi:hypothetical protein